MKRSYLGETKLHDEHRRANVLNAIKPSELDTDFCAKIVKIGIRNRVESEPNGFLFENQKYRLLVDIDVLKSWLKGIF